MRRKMWVWFLVCFFGFGLQVVWAESKWWPGIIHTHSTFSDGFRSPKLLINRAKGVGEFIREVGRPRFLIVTDHYEQIDNFDSYRDRFSKLASSDFVIITGAEITTYWNDAASHLLALGDISFDDNLMKLQGQKDKQQAVIDRVNELGLLSVAAHPSLTALRYRQWAGKFDNLQFDPTVKTGLKGIEFFNDEPEGYSRTRDLWYLTRLRRGDNIFVTAGCDSHWPADVYDDDRWRKKTWVFSEKLETKPLLEAMGQGRTYAAQHGASFENLNYIPGFQAQEVERPKLQFFVTFDKKITSSKTIRIYRDGKLIESSVQTYKKENIKGLQKIAYVWEDKEVKEGEHLYVIEVEGVLITSPIRLKIKKQLPPITGTAVIEGKYFFQESPKRYLELRKDGTVTYYPDLSWNLYLFRPRLTLEGLILVPRFIPEEIRWMRLGDVVSLTIKKPRHFPLERCFIKGNGLLVSDISGMAWVKEGVRYSFSQEEVSGNYKSTVGKLVLRPDGTCTYTDEMWEGKQSANGRWEIEGNLISAELVGRLPAAGELILRVLDRNTLIEQCGPGYIKLVRQEVGAKAPTGESNEDKGGR